MSINLSLLPADEKQRIELDKQASFIVWQIKNGKATAEQLRQAESKLNVPDEQQAFQASVAKYKQMMNVV